MDRTERFYKIEQLLHERGVVRLEQFMETLGVSRATFKRDLDYLRDRLHAPIEWDRKARGYRLAQDRQSRFELPGLWFNASEIHALLTMQHLLANLQPGLLTPHIAPLQARLNTLLEHGENSADEVRRRIRILHVAARPVAARLFQEIAQALLNRRRLRLRHYNRGEDRHSEREVSPQRLVYYRDNWYLDAWCHWRDALRCFAVDTLDEAAALDEPAIALTEDELNAALGESYGIFAGRALQTAVLRFTAKRARWVAHECWHPRQTGGFEPDGRYRLELPYADDRELLMDILKYGPDVEVLAPDSLRGKVIQALAATAALYAAEPASG